MRNRGAGAYACNADRKLLDAWLFALCTWCGDANEELTVLRRMKVRPYNPSA
ncbi:DUF1062 domain-containing protein [Streptomyces sp. NPDC058620]|uniref:DUF1062 domain-containing protein n=1 Tax=Streptomyces sp. NPDC058620 TaxID=3346560 RepID=UPI00364BFDCB